MPCRKGKDSAHAAECVFYPPEPRKSSPWLAVLITLAIAAGWVGIAILGHHLAALPATYCT